MCALLLVNANIVLAEAPKPTTNQIEVVLSADEWCPYNCSPDSPTPGYMLEIANQAFELHAPGKYRVVYKQLPWTRSMKMAQRGDIDGIIGAIASEAEGLHVPSEEQGLMFAKFFALKQTDWSYTNTQQLKKDAVIIGAIAGYDYDASIAQYIVENPKTVHLAHGDPALPSLIKLLNLKRIHALIEDQAVFWYNIKSLGHDSNLYKVAGDIEEPQKLFLAFHKKEYADIVAKGMHKLRKSGALKKILSKYNLADWK
ncbi:MAG: transporter substrate-binding domain-containing protein [Pseudomonadales bacterium]|nr:transporter substrate-binding domain-containing protein [Pseudomonadales bacterium]